MSCYEHCISCERICECPFPSYVFAKCIEWRSANLFGSGGRGGQGALNGGMECKAAEGKVRVIQGSCHLLLFISILF